MTLSRDFIKKKLQEDAYWEPDEDISQKEWELFDEVYNELDEQGLLEFKGSKDSAWDDEDSDDDDDWEDDEE